MTKASKKDAFEDRSLQPQSPTSSSVHLQDTDFTARTIQSRSAPENAGTKHPDVVGRRHAECNAERMADSRLGKDDWLPVFRGSSGYRSFSPCPTQEMAEGEKPGSNILRDGSTLVQSGSSRTALNGHPSDIASDAESRDGCRASRLPCLKEAAPAKGTDRALHEFAGPGEAVVDAKPAVLIAVGMAAIVGDRFADLGLGRVRRARGQHAGADQHHASGALPEKSAPRDSGAILLPSTWLAQFLGHAHLPCRTQASRGLGLRNRGQ